MKLFDRKSLKISKHYQENHDNFSVIDGILLSVSIHFYNVMQELNYPLTDQYKKRNMLWQESMP